MYYDPRVEIKAHHLCHVLAETDASNLTLEEKYHKKRHDIFTTSRVIASYWKEELDKETTANYHRRYNELRRWIRDNPKATTEDILEVILFQEMNNAKVSIRDLVVV